MNRSTDSVRIAIFERGDPTFSRFLGLTETDDQDNWKLPGGKFESDTEAADDAAGRELGEELGVTGEEVGLTHAATLVNNDGVSARHIYAATAEPGMLQPSAEIAQTAWFTDDTVLECKNRDHMLAAVAAARSVFGQTGPIEMA